MKVKNVHLMQSMQFLGKINTSDISIKTSFHISTVINRVNSVMVVVEELRKKIIEECTEKDASDNKIFVDPDKRYVKLTEAGEKNMEELLNLESDIEIEQFTLDQLEAAGVKVAPALINSIKWMIK